MLHGFAADAHANWHQPKVVETVVATGRRVITPDARGHGRSGKPHDIDAYKNQAMPRDVSALLDHLGLAEVDVVGYSMGARITAQVAMREPRVRSIVLGGVGAGVVQGRGPAGAEAIAAALTAPDTSVDRRRDRPRVPSVRGVDGCRSRSPRGGDAGGDGRADAVRSTPCRSRRS